MFKKGLMPSSNSVQKKQSGFILILLVVILLVGAVAYFVGATRNLAWQLSTESKFTELNELNKIKKQLLLFAFSFSELYSTNSSGNMLDSKKVPAPGYLPCPYDVSVGNMSSECAGFVVDPSGTGNALANPGFVIGFLPAKVSSRYFYFLGNYVPQSSLASDYIMLVDERFVYKNSHYTSVSGSSIQRYSPLNNNLINTGPANKKPVLRLNDDGNEYVALLIRSNSTNLYPAQDQATLRPIAGLTSANPLSRFYGHLDKRFSDAALTTEVNGNQDNDFRFFSAAKGNYGVNDVIVGISYDEWINVVKDRVCSQRDSLNDSDADDGFWFDAYDSSNNRTGASWRGRVTNAFCQ